MPTERVCEMKYINANIHRRGTNQASPVQGEVASSDDGGVVKVDFFKNNPPVAFRASPLYTQGPLVWCELSAKSLPQWVAKRRERNV